MKNRSKTSVIIIILIFLSTNLLSGCQLAKEDNLENHSSEKLCGAFVTVNLDTSQLYNDMLKDAEFIVNSNGELEIKQPPASANTVEGTMTDGHVKFGDFTGYYMGEGIFKDSKGKNVHSNFSDKGFYDVKCAVNDTEAGVETSFEGSLSLSRYSSSIIHINPVYQRGDGSFYVALGQNPGMSTSGNSLGMVYSQSLSNETTSSGNGNAKRDKTAFKVNLFMADEAKQIVIKEMNKKDELIKASEYFPDSPEKYIVAPETCYVIVEEYTNSKENTINRSIYNVEGVNLEEYYTSHVCHFPGKDSIIGVKSVRFVNKK